MKKHKIQLIFSYTGTYFSKFLKIVMRSKYAHISICLDGDIKEVYSFGRKNHKLMFPAGFVNEDLEYIDKVSGSVSCLIYELDVSDYQFKKLKKSIKEYIKEQDKYQYDILGLTFMVLGKPYQRRYHRVCSQFVGKVLQDSDIYDFNGKHYSLIRPTDFYNIPNKRLLHQGKMKEYLDNLKKE